MSKFDFEPGGPLRTRKEREEVEKPIIDLEFEIQDDQVLVRNIYQDGTRGMLEVVTGLNPSNTQEFRRAKEKIIKGYRERGFWAGK